MTRSDADSCPGVLRLHEAADGPLARVRVPGGQLGAAGLQALAEAAAELGDGALELTSRGNVQLRGIRDAAALTERLGAAGLLPTATHERVRNIVASPLSGLAGGVADVRELVPALDAGLRAAPELAGLPGRVLFTLDDGRGDVSGFGGDIGLHAVEPGVFAVLLAGADSGIRVAAGDAVGLVLAAARAFAQVRGGGWRLAEVADGAARVRELLGFASTAPGPVLPDPADHPPIGWLPQDDGLVALGAGVRLGVLPARTALFVAAVEKPVLVTPWRGLVLPDLDEWSAEQVVRVLAPMGLIFDAESPWVRVSSCAGAPGCAKSHTDVRADATAAVESGRVASPADGTGAALGPIPAGDVLASGRQHWSGCERRCGHPHGPATDIVAGPDGYRVTGP
ncbi:precorrin-3B synthase [Nocardia asteroides]|uniref:precorrin-3B synthase n=1 Tax=Nocardia asteroides TaxID=1824 RepID=UPI001E5B7148|nr:precorrin-3B synthase [Nocardia asteroides]UGT62931.1 precorrin-3B synthase [Nocardia asteroides]